MSATCICSVRQLSVRKISFFEPHSRGIAHPGSGSAQSLLRFCFGWLTFAHPKFYDVYWLESDLPLPSGWPTARWWTKGLIVSSMELSEVDGANHMGELISPN